MTVLPKVDLPQPLSPTRPNTSPCFSSKDTSSTAFTNFFSREKRPVLTGKYFFRYDKGPLLIINTNEIDFVNNPEDLNGIMDFLKEPIKGKKYYNPIKSF